MLAARYTTLKGLKNKFPFVDDGILLPKLVAYSSKLVCRNYFKQKYILITKTTSFNIFVSELICLLTGRLHNGFSCYQIILSKEFPCSVHTILEVAMYNVIYTHWTAYFILAYLHILVSTLTISDNGGVDIQLRYLPCFMKIVLPSLICQ